MSAQPPFNTPDTPVNPYSFTMKKSLLMALLVILAGEGAGGAWFFLSGGKPHSTEETKPAEAEHDSAHEEQTVEEAEPPFFVNLETFTVNLQPDGQFLQATFSLQFKSEKEAEQFKIYMPQMRSRLLLMLSSKTADTLANQKGKTDLIAEIKQLLSQPVKPGLKAIPVEDVHVTAFMIQ